MWPKYNPLPILDDCEDDRIRGAAHIATDMCRSNLEVWGTVRHLYRAADGEFFVVRKSLWPSEDPDVIWVNLETALWLYYGPLCCHVASDREAFYRGEEFPPCEEGEIRFPSSEPQFFNGEEGILLASDRCRGSDPCWGMYRTLYRTPSGKFYVARTSLWPGEKDVYNDTFEIGLAEALWLYHGPLCWHKASPREAFYTGEPFPPCYEDDEEEGEESPHRFDE